MGLVVAILVAVLAGCYEPELRDCTVSCAAADECAQGQSCTATGFCAATGATCMAGPPKVDAAVAAVDAPPAGPMDMLRVTVMGKGEVAIDSIGSCTNGDTMGMGTTCPFQIPAGIQVVAHAQTTDMAHAFDKWTDPICKNQGVTCTFTASLPVIVIAASFKN